MSQLGQLLRETRIKNKISLDELQETTKIRKGYLEAIEEGNYRILPGSFYVKAFIRTYAEALGIDPVEALNMYKMEAAPEPEEEAPVEPTVRKRSRGSRNTEKWSRIASTVLVISFIVLIIIVIYYFQYNNTSRSPESTNEGIKITDKASPPSIESPTPTNTSTPSATPTPTPTPTPNVSELKSAGKEGKLEVYEVTNADKLTISLNVTGKECWFSAKTTDENNKKITLDSLTLKNGESREWEATKPVEIVLGAAGAVELKVNGIVVPVGDELNVKNFKFILPTS